MRKAIVSYLLNLIKSHL